MTLWRSACLDAYKHSTGVMATCVDFATVFVGVLCLDLPSGGKQLGLFSPDSVNSSIQTGKSDQPNALHMFPAHLLGPHAADTCLLQVCFKLRKQT